MTVYEGETILSERKFKAGYIARKVLIPGEQYGGQDFEMTYAITPDGEYIGSTKDAHYLCKKRGIKPELKKLGSQTCSIGFCEREQKWYGWSHRAIHGFGIGDIAREGDCCTIPGSIDEHIEEHPEDDFSVPVGFKAETLEDAKRMAIAFADGVS